MRTGRESQHGTRSLWRVAFAIIGMAALLLASSCGGDDDDADDATSSSRGAGDGDAGSELETSTLRIGFASNNVDQAIVDIADQMGFLEAVGLSVEIVYFGDGPSSTRALLSNDVDIVMGSLQAPLLAQAAGQDMVAFYGATRPQFSIWAQPNVADVDDLEGGSIATNPPGSLPALLTEHMLDELTSFGADGVTMVPIVGSAKISSLETGQTDAAILSAAEAYWAEDNGFTMLATMRDFDGSVPNTYNAMAPFVDANPNALRAFSTAIEQAIELRDSDPDAVLDVAVNFTDLEREHAERALREIADYQPQHGAIDETDSALLVDMMLASGDIDRAYERDEYIDSTLIGE